MALSLLFTTLLPVLIIGVATSTVGALIARREHDAWIAVLTTAGAVVSVLRVTLVWTYRRRRPAMFDSVSCP